MSPRDPWSVSEEPRPSPNPKPHLGIPMDDPHGGHEDPPRGICGGCGERKFLHRVLAIAGGDIDSLTERCHDCILRRKP